MNQPGQRWHPGGAALTFLGGAGTVTGSRFLVETAFSRVLVDCGLFQGLKSHRRRNWEPFPVDPATVDAVVVSHAHVDHIGYLPRLCEEGFGGSVLSTPGTADLAAIVLPDSGHLQEEEAEWANRGGWSVHHPALPLYTERDARRSLRRFRPVRFGSPTPLTSDIAVTLRPAGHILGSAIVTLDIEVSGGTRRIVFSGDLGRPRHPLLVMPASPVDADVIVMESTYGARRHDDAGALDLLGRVITETAARGGTVVIPAFAVDRTEIVLHELRALMRSGKAPTLPVYVDSPMALRTLAVYRRAIADGAPDIRPEICDGTAFGGDPFDTGSLHEVRSVEESKALADAPVPSIIVSASGMATGGRVLHHLARLLPDPRNSVILVGFQAAGTRGWRLAAGEHEVKMLGRHVRVRAEVTTLNAFSVHADCDELLAWLASADRPPDITHLVHGEPDAAGMLQSTISRRLGWPVGIASHRQQVPIGSPTGPSDLAPASRSGA